MFGWCLFVCWEVVFLVFGKFGVVLFCLFGLVLGVVIVVKRCERVEILIEWVVGVMGG